MAQLPPSAVFGSSRPGQAVHVLFLIENSLPMVDHWQDLQQHILPGVLGAVRIANPGINVSKLADWTTITIRRLLLFHTLLPQVQIFWETTGKTQDQRPAYKSQRHFNDFPDIDIVGLPQNKLSPLFIRRSIDVRVFPPYPPTPCADLAAGFPLSVVLVRRHFKGAYNASLVYRGHVESYRRSI